MFKKPFPFIITLLLLLFAFVCFMPLIITKASWFSLGVNKPNEIGDTVGGIMGPLVGFIGAIAAFLAFWIQYKANQKQFKQFKRQKNDIKIERFENRFYELLKIHRDNVQEFEIVRSEGDLENKLTGRRIFVSMVDELRLCYTIINDANKMLINEKAEFQDFFTNKELYNIAYFVFMYGFDDANLSYKYHVGKPFLYKLLDEKYHSILDKAIPLFEKIQKMKPKEIYSLTYGNIIDKIDVPKIKYKLFSGHNSRLPHYFRHLYQTVKFVTQQDEGLFKDEDKYAYIKMIRAQLSNYEQVLLYYNSISVLGKPWIDDRFLTEWRMVKNMPLYVANFGLLPKDILGEVNSKGEKLFEVDEIIKNINE